MENLKKKSLRKNHTMLMQLKNYGDLFYNNKKIDHEAKK